MYVIYPAADVVEESYLALVAQEIEVPPPTGLTSVRNTELVAPSIYHDTTDEQLRAEGYLQGDFFEAAEAYRGLPDLVPAHVTSGRSSFKNQDYQGRVETTLIMATSGGGSSTMAADLGISVVGIGGMRVSIRDLIHPTLNDSLKGQQQVTFKLVKTVSDFSHALSKIHEQYADDLQSLVEDFRRKNVELRNERPSCNNSLFNVWDSLLQETELDASVHTDIAGVLSRAVSRPLLEKTFHMKIQSRKVFTNRESYENLLGKTEDLLLKCHSDYSIAFEVHGNQKSPMSASNVIEAHNNYVQQLHGTNGMIEQYYQVALPELLQELDYVYHDVSGVMTESLMQGAEMIAMKTADTARRYDSFRRRVKEINPVTDLNAFIKSLNIPETVTITTHNYAPPQVRDPIQLDGLPPFRDELVVDRSSQNVARNRFDSLRKEAQDLEMQIRQLSDALETLVRIQAKSLESQLYNKANELQEDISGKRFDQKVAQIHLAAVRAQKEMFASKVDSGMGGVGGGGVGGGAPSGGDFSRERKLSSTSSTGSMKNKWVKAFKSIKGGKEQPVEPQSRQRNGKDNNGSVLPQAMSENAHIFQEYTYKKITPCDVCSQILRGHTRQGLKCKLCRMNIHPDCQDPSLKCQPKSRLLRRQKSASEIEARYFGGGDQADNDNFFPQRQRSDSAASIQQWLTADDRRTQFSNMKSISMESGQSSSSRGSDVQLQGPNAQSGQRGFGGSYSASTGCSSKVITNTLNISGGVVEQPKLAQVAIALMKAKAAGQLPSALGNKAVVERVGAANTQDQPGGPGQPPPEPSVPPDVTTSTMQQRRTLQSSS